MSRLQGIDPPRWFDDPNWRRRSHQAIVFLIPTLKQRRASWKQKAGPLGMLAGAFEHIPKNPFVNLASSFRRKIDEANAALPRARRPRNLALRLHSKPRMIQFETHAYWLLRTQGRYHLQPDSAVTDVANDPAVRLLHRGVAQRSQFVPVLAPRLPRQRYSNIHTSPPNEFHFGQSRAVHLTALKKYLFSNQTGSQSSSPVET